MKLVPFLSFFKCYICPSPVRGSLPILLQTFKEMKGWPRGRHWKSDPGLPSGSPLWPDPTPQEHPRLDGTSRAAWVLGELAAQVGTSTQSTGRESFKVQHISPHVPLWTVQRQLWLVPWDAGIPWVAGRESKSPLFSLPFVITDFRGEAKCRLKTCVETVPWKKNAWRSLYLHQRLPWLRLNEDSDGIELCNL